MIQILMRHRLLRELRVRLVGVGDEGDAPCRQHPYAIDLAPFREVSGDDLFDVVSDVDPADVEGAVLTHEGAHAAHVVAIVGVFVTTETVDVGVEGVEEAGKSVKVFALLTAGTEAFGEEETEIAAGDLVASSVS